MFKKTVSIVIVSVLAISIGAVSVFAVPTANYTYQLNYSYQDLKDSDDNLLAQVLYELNASDPYIYQLDSNREVKQWNQPGTTQSGSGAYTAWTWDESSDIVYASDISVYVRITNYTENTLALNKRFFRLNIQVAQMRKSNNYTVSVLSNPPWSLGSTNNCYILPERQYFYAIPLDQFTSGDHVVLTPHQTLTLSFNFSIYHTVQRQDTAINTWLNDYYIGFAGVQHDDTLTAYVDNDIEIYNPYYNVYSILDAYKQNVQSAEDLSSDITTNDEKLDNIHQNEAQWYSQNSQAIESTGLSNFEFSTDQSSALTGVFSLFQRLWTALGDYTFVVTFTLMMSFATFFLRHNPVKKTSGNNYSRNYSKGGGESHGSSA